MDSLPLHHSEAQKDHKGYYKQLYAYKHENLDEFCLRYTLPEHKQEEIDNLNMSKSIKDTD